MSRYPVGVPSYARFTVEERREQLLELGLRLFGSRAYDEISIEEISQLAGMSKGLLYHYFPSKRDFYVACLRTAEAQLYEVTDPRPDLPPRERMRAGLSAYLDHVLANLAKCQALFRGGIGADPEVIEITEATRRVIWDRTLRGVGAASDERLLSVAVRWWVSFVEVSALDWAASGGGDKEALIDVLVAVLAAAVRESRRERDALRAHRRATS